MSETFVNYNVKCNDFEVVCLELPHLIDGEAYISPSKNGWITVYDQMTEFELDYQRIQTLAQNLSDRCNSLVITFVVVDEIQFSYFIHENNQLVDSFDSSYEPISSSSLEVHTRLLMNYCLPSTSITSILDILSSLQEENPQYMGSDFPYLLAPMLNIEPDRVFLGFSRFTSDNLSDYGTISDDHEHFHHCSR